MRDNSDAALLAACAEYHRRHTEWHGPYADDEENTRLCGLRSAALKVVVATQHTTSEGLRAKAGVAHSAMLFEVGGVHNGAWRAEAEDEQILAVDVTAGLAGEVVV